MTMTYALAKTTWTNGIRMVVQQTNSKFQRLCTPMRPRGAEMFSEWMGDTEMERGQSDGAPIEHATGDFRRRWIDTNFYYKAWKFDTLEEMDILKDPRNVYINSTLAAGNRAVDDEILRAIEGEARAGEKGNQFVPFDPNQIIPHGGTGFTLAKVRQAMRFFKDNDADDDDTGMGLDLSVIWTPQDEETFLGDEKVTSSDYNTVRFLVQGGIKRGDKFYGANYTSSSRIKSDGAGVHTAYMFRRDAVEYGFKKQLTPTVDRLVDRVGQPWQIYADMKVGAVRMQEQLVVGIQCQYPV